MLTHFAVTNYKGFKHRIEWDLSHPSNYSFNADAVQEGVVKNGIIYGPNGAGKSISVWLSSILPTICLINGRSQTIT
jgi:AAA15 family ATPase/GTPase